ncbi:hypothetical protein ABZ499_32240 [Streptomyces sp. NPDC019990]|uniref:hypothetical protein n=1 Tax=Streptomyces sp. NPDC019990 TaxID=3154693 RepID=UPI0033F96269
MSASPCCCGPAPPHDVADHKTVLASQFRQLPLPLWSKLLVRIDGAAFSHALLDHLHQLSTSRRRVRWVTDWAVNATDEQAIALLPAKVWTAALRQDGKVHEIKGPDSDMVWRRRQTRRAAGDGPAWSVFFGWLRSSLWSTADIAERFSHLIGGSSPRSSVADRSRAMSHQDGSRR